MSHQTHASFAETPNSVIAQFNWLKTLFKNSFSKAVSSEQSSRKVVWYTTEEQSFCFLSSWAKPIPCKYVMQYSIVCFTLQNLNRILETGIQKRESKDDSSDLTKNFLSTVGLSNTRTNSSYCSRTDKDWRSKSRISVEILARVLACWNLDWLSSCRWNGGWRNQ